jgi:MYXO-CTERM domain-containing protein
LAARTSRAANEEGKTISMRVRRVSRAAAAALVSFGVVGAYASGASAAQVFYESWENGSSNWRAVDGNPIVLTSDTTDCSSTYQHETILYSAGRVFTNSAIAVTAGQPYCLSAWIRGSANTQPFLGLNISNNASGSSLSTEHWLIGDSGFNTGYGGTVTPVTSDGNWHWYTYALTMDSGASYVVLKDELFAGGSAGSGDFDDITLWSGACPSTPNGAAHVTCSGSAAICSAGQCVQCTSSNEAACTGGTPFCNTTTDACRACTSADCSGSTPACATTGTNAGECVACTSDTNCSGSTPRCNTSTNTCVACLDGTTCSGSTPACNTTTDTCEACAADYSASAPAAGSCPTSAAPACQSGSGSLVGECTACSATNDSVCAADSVHPACQTATGVCGCSQDTDCAKGMYCNTSSGTAGACASGCQGTGVANCPAGQYCAGSGGVGTCTGEPCDLNTDCTGTNKVCNTTPFPHSCVACLLDTDCASGQVCDTATNTCGQCTSSEKSNCSASGAGAACLSNDTCGCASSGDCGSGLTCNTTTHACVAVSVDAGSDSGSGTGAVDSGSGTGATDSGSGTGAADSGSGTTGPVDSGAADSATSTTDGGGTELSDAGVASSDAGAASADASASEDATTTAADAGTSEEEAGMMASMDATTTSGGKDAAGTAHNDASTTEEEDAGATSTPNGSSGCGCTVVGTGDSTLSGLGAALGLMAVLARRRRRHQS